MKYQTGFITLLLLAASACSTMPEKPPQAKGHTVPINSLDTAEKLAHDAGYAIVGDKRGEQEVREFYLWPEKKQIPAMTRAANREDYAYIEGADFVERTVYVPFAYASTQFRPTKEQQTRLQLLSAVADRVQVRGRTDGTGKRHRNEKVARQRALAAQRYLVSIGVPHEIISVNHVAKGDFIADDYTKSGRAQNRRVEIEFVIDDFTDQAPVKLVDAE